MLLALEIYINLIIDIFTPKDTRNWNEIYSPMRSFNKKCSALNVLVTTITERSSLTRLSVLEGIPLGKVVGIR